MKNVIELPILSSNYTFTVISLPLLRRWQWCEIWTRDERSGLMINESQPGVVVMQMTWVKLRDDCPTYSEAVFTPTRISSVSV